MSAKLVTAIFLILSSGSAYAADQGPGSSGGGDTCERTFKTVRGAIAKWIKYGGPKYLTFNQGESQDAYSSRMLGEMKEARVQCVGAGDVGYPVQINGTPKTCRWDRNESSTKVTCDIQKFDALEFADQIKLVHHEYASLAGYEIPHEDDSDYRISGQLSDFLTYELTQQLAVRAPVKDGSAVVTRYEGYNGEYHKMVHIKGPNQPSWEVVRSWNHYTFLNYSASPRGASDLRTCFVRSLDNGLSSHQSYIAYAFTDEEARKALTAIVVDDRQPAPTKIVCQSSKEFESKYPRDLDQFFEQIDP